MSRLYRRGFTTVEVMMVILILALLAALLTNAVQSSRERARRTQCLNKMREVGQAVIKYETDNTGYPGWCHPVLTGTPPNQVRYLNSWIYQILPSLGKNDVFATQGLDSFGNPLPPVALNDLLVCPSDPDKMAMRSPLNPTSIVCNAGRQDYVPATATMAADWRSNAVFMNRSGVDSNGALVKVDVTDASFIAKGDGLAATLLVSESIDAIKWNTLQAPGGTPDETINCIVFWPPPLADVHRINGPRAGATAYDLARPSSYHPGGVNVFFCDGHGQFIRESIDYWVYCALMTPRGANALEPGTTNPSPAQIRNQPQITEAALQ